MNLRSNWPKCSLSENWMRSRCCHHFWVQILPCRIPLQRPRPLSCFWSPLTNSMQVIQSQACKRHWGLVAHVFYLPTSANHSKFMDRTFLYPTPLHLRDWRRYHFPKKAVPSAKKICHTYSWPVSLTWIWHLCQIPSQFPVELRIAL